MAALCAGDSLLPLAVAGAVSIQRETNKQELPIRLAQKERRRASNRIKLSRELMVRLSAALGDRRQEPQPKATTYPDSDGKIHRRHCLDSGLGEPAKSDHAEKEDFEPPERTGITHPEKLLSDGSDSGELSARQTREPGNQMVAGLAQVERAASPLNSCSNCTNKATKDYKRHDHRRSRRHHRQNKWWLAMAIRQSEPMWPRRHLNNCKHNNDKREGQLGGRQTGGHHKSFLRLELPTITSSSDGGGCCHFGRRSLAAAAAANREAVGLQAKPSQRVALRRPILPAGLRFNRPAQSRKLPLARGLTNVVGGGKSALPRHNGSNASRSRHKRQVGIWGSLKRDQTLNHRYGPFFGRNLLSAKLGFCRSICCCCCCKSAKTTNADNADTAPPSPNRPTEDRSSSNELRDHFEKINGPPGASCRRDNCRIPESDFRLPTKEKCCQTNVSKLEGSICDERPQIEGRLVSIVGSADEQQPVIAIENGKQLRFKRLRRRRQQIEDREFCSSKSRNLNGLSSYSSELISDGCHTTINEKLNYERPSVILEPPLEKRIPRSPANQPAEVGQAKVPAGSEHNLCLAREQSATNCYINYDHNNNNDPSNERSASSDKHYSREIANIGFRNCISGRSKGRSWRRRNKARKRCDRLIFSKSRSKHQAAGSKWPFAGTCWRRALLWMLIGGALLILFQPIGQVGRVSGQEQQRRPPASDEFRDTVLATMSTQSPINTIEEPSQVAAAAAAANNGSSGASNVGPPIRLTGIKNGQLDELNSISEPAQPPDVLERILTFCRIFVMGAIIVGDICGNSLVILSVCRHSKLRVTTNWFVVSLACADILVALFAMTFNASVIISGRWLFKPWVCDFWNSCDVLASTASILHLCCISIDRYIAITRPLDYPMKITTRRVVYALCGVWISSALLSYIPIFTGVYTTAEHIKWLEDNPEQCDFVVNRVYAVVSSSISFWIPSSIMVFTYYRIYKEATRQEKFIYKAQSMMPAPMSNHQHSSSNHASGALKSKQRRSKSMAFSSTGGPTTGAPGQSSNEARIRQLARQQNELQQQQPAHPGPLSSSTTNKLDPSGNQSLLPIEGGIATTNLSQPAPVNERASSLLQLAERNDSGGAAELSSGESEPLRAATGAIKADLNNNNNNNNNTKGKNNKKQPVAKVSGFGKRRPKSSNKNSNKVNFDEEEDEDDDDDGDSISGQSTPTKRSISKMKREHKAAKTLGIIMGVFILCWLPFFSWYTPQHICGHACDGIVPRGAVTILFWIGYFNSTLNPIIYAYFNHEFRDAFKKTLQWIFCCCNDLKCLRVNRPNDNQHYNCTYRSTQEIGLVSNS